MSDDPQERRPSGASPRSKRESAEIPAARASAPPRVSEGSPPRVRTSARQAELRGILDDFMVEVARDASVPRSPGFKPFDPRPYVATVAVLLCIAVWGFRPTERSLAETPQIQETRDAGIRLSIYLTSQKIEQFRSAYDSLPREYNDSTGIVYTWLSEDVYQLAFTVNANQIIIFNSLTTPAADFLGKSVDILAPPEQRPPA